MRIFRKTAILFMALLLSLSVVWPASQALAASITRFYIFDAGSYLIAGNEYIPVFESDKGFMTSVEYVKYEYSTDNGATWINLPTYSPKGYMMDFFRLPIDPQLISAKFRVSAYYSPLIGAKSYSEKTIGPYKILQPADPSDLTATPNDDATVTLKWNDNSNMESYYQITRYGPDGTKTFEVNDTMNRIGPITYVDKQTNKDKSSVYVYTISAIIDKYNLPDNLQPGNVNVIAKTKVPLKEADLFRLDLNTPIASLGTEYTYLQKFNIHKVADLNKVAVNSVKLDKPAMILKKGERGALTATVVPSSATKRNVAWSSDNPDVAEVDSKGNVTGKAAGSAKISAKTEDGGFTAVSVVTVIEVPDLKIIQTNLGNGKLIYDPNIIQSTPNAEMDMINLQQVVSERQEALELARKLNESLNETTKDIVGNIGGGGAINAAFVYISDEAVTLRVGENRQVTAMVAPPDATNQSVSWSSSNPQVAEVDSNGGITGKSKGTATITVRTADGGFTNSCEVTVVNNLTDVSGHKANTEIMLAMTQGIVSGYPDETFRPDGDVTRAEFTVMLMNGIQPGAASTELAFKDKNSIGDWAQQPVAQAVQLGIISGYDDGTFRPDAKITRAEMISMVIRASGLETEEGQQSGFTDQADIPDWAKKAANTAEQTGIIIVGGLPESKFAPQTLSTRAEAASAIVRMLMIKK